ncbi:hypothetical protein ACQY0O_006107 [Thecaphora frezii]
MMDWAATEDTLNPTHRTSPRRHQPPLPSARPTRPRQPSSSSSVSAASETEPRQSSDYAAPRTSGTSMTSSRRMRDPRPTMDVKVLYTLDTSPELTMVARMGRPVPVDVVRPVGGPPSPLQGGPAQATSLTASPFTPRFGRVTLKSCLSAICIASPELIFDRKRDYIIYAVDPEETFRAAQHRSPTSPPRTYLGRTASDRVAHAHPHAESSKSGAAPAAAAAATVSHPSPSAMLVGKGYFSWGLEEQGNGDTVVSGKVRSEGTRTVYLDGQVVEESIDVLEVVLRMKETQARSKDQYYSLVRGFSAASSSPAMEPPPSTDRSRASRQPLHPPPSERRASRSAQLQSEPDYLHAREQTSSAGPSSSQRASRRGLAPAADVFDKRLHPFASSGVNADDKGRSQSPAKHAASPQQQPQQASSPAAAVSGPLAANSQALQLLTLLQALQNHQTKPGQQAPPLEQQAQLSSLLGLVAGALGAGLDGDAAKDGSTGVVAGSLATPPAQQHQHQEQLLATVARPATGGAIGSNGQRRGLGSASTTPARADSPAWLASGAGDEAADDGETLLSKYVCYNCGTTSNKTWRVLSLPSGAEVNFPASEKPPAGTPSNGYVCRFADRNGPVLSDGCCRWTACNPCGLHFLRYKEARPRHVWDPLCRSKAKQREVEKWSGSAQPEGKARKRAKVSHHGDGDVHDGGSHDSATSPAFGATTATPRSSSSAAIGSKKPLPSSEKKAGLPRTLSEVCQREEDKIEAERLEKEQRGPPEMPKSKEAQRGMVLDDNGLWRSRRSVRENPTGRKVGRPKGSTKKNKALAQANTNTNTNNSTSTSKAEGDNKSKVNAIAGDENTPTNGATRSATTAARAAQENIAAADDKALALASAASNGGEAVFRAPALPLPSAASRAGQSLVDLCNPTGRTVSFAQSSPVRPSIASRNNGSDVLSSIVGHAAPLESPSRDLRFRVPNYLLNSSPGTMMDTLMSEADIDFEELGPVNFMSTPGSLLGFTANLDDTPASLRRSPRKNPHGTKSDQNPYATGDEPASPSLGQSARALGGARLLRFSSDESPVTRSRTRSGQSVLHPALFSSSDSPTSAKRHKGAHSSSSATSPISPTPRRIAKHAGGGGDKGTSSASTITEQKQAAQSRADGRAHLLSEGDGNDDGDDEDDDEDGDEERLVKGPFGGGRRDGSAETSTRPGSPSLGPATRKLDRTESLRCSNNNNNKDSNGCGAPSSILSGAARLSQFDLPPSSPPMFEHPTGDSGAHLADVETDRWTRRLSLRSLVPTPSDVDWASEGNPSPAKPAGAAERIDPTNAAVKAYVAATTAAPSASASPAMALVPLGGGAHVSRRPLPATVEDASTTSGSSPEDGDTPDGMSSLFDLFDDAHGLLAASGFGVQGSQGGMSADVFGDVELHRSLDFAAHLDDFTQHGGVGVAAHVAPSGTSVVAIKPAQLHDGSPVAAAAATAEAGAGTEQYHHHHTAVPPSDALVETTQPAAEASAEAATAPEGQEDLLALLCNPDIQAMLAEFGDLPKPCVL